MVSDLYKCGIISVGSHGQRGGAFDAWGTTVVRPPETMPAAAVLHDAPKLHKSVTAPGAHLRLA